MNRAAAILVVFIVALVAASAVSAAGAAVPPRAVVVTLAPGSGATAARELAGSVGGRVIGAIPALNAYLIELPAGSLAPADAAGSLSGRPLVRTAEQTRLYRPLEIPAVAAPDPQQGAQWHLAKIHAATAWATTTGDPGVVIAVIDTGVDYTHPDLAANVTIGPDLADDDADPMDTYGHGTHVAGIAAAVAGNGIGGSGVCPACRILAIKVFPDGSGSADDFTVAEGITWAADHGADVVNLSLGGPGSSTVLENAVNYATSHNVLVVAAAGNESTSAPSYPGAIPAAMGVAATTNADTKASFSNYGSWVDIAAPGVGILSTVPGGGYESWSGTSMATPVVAGAAGLALAGRPGATAASVRSLLQSTTASVAASSREPRLGYGRVDLLKLFSGTGGGSSTAPQIVTGALPAARIGVQYLQVLTATGGTQPYVWSIASGSLPTGLTLTSNGTITGTPTVRGSATFALRVTDAASKTATRSLTITVTSSTGRAR